MVMATFALGLGGVAALVVLWDSGVADGTLDWALTGASVAVGAEMGWSSGRAVTLDKAYTLSRRSMVLLVVLGLVVSRAITREVSDEVGLWYSGALFAGGLVGFLLEVTYSALRAEREPELPTSG